MRASSWRSTSSAGRDGITASSAAEDMTRAATRPSATTSSTSTAQSSRRTTSIYGHSQEELDVLNVIEAERRMRLLETPTIDLRSAECNRVAPRPSRPPPRYEFESDEQQQRKWRLHYEPHEAMLLRSGGRASKPPRIFNPHARPMFTTPRSTSSSSESEYGDDEDNRIFGSIDPLQLGCDDPWRWSRTHRSCEVMVTGPQARTVLFHPNWSKGTAGVRGTRVLNNGRFYWEIHVANRVFGTSMMFGIGTEEAQLHIDNFTNLLGANEHSWGMSHKGIVWHNGTGLRYAKCFKENLATTIGLLFDGIDGTLTYYKDGVCLGVAFRELNMVQEPLYPIVCSTAAKTEMELGQTRREFVSLQDRCRAEICKLVRTKDEMQKLQHQMRLPPSINRYLEESFLP